MYTVAPNPYRERLASISASSKVLTRQIGATGPKVSLFMMGAIAETSPRTVGSTNHPLLRCGGPATACEHCGASSVRRIQHPQIPRQFSFGGEGPHVDVAEAVADPYLRSVVNQSLDKFIVHPLVHVEALSGCAYLTAIEVRSESCGPRCDFYGRGGPLQ